MPPKMPGNSDAEESAGSRRRVTCGYRRYYISLLMSMGYSLAYSTRANMSVAILYMTEKKNRTRNGITVLESEFAWDENLQSYTLSAFFYGYILTQIPGGYFSGLIGGHYVLLIGIAGSGLLTLIVPIAATNSFVALIFVRVACGLLQGMIIPAAHAIWAKWAPPYERTILTGLGISGNFFAPVFVLPLCGLVGDHLGWEWMFYIFAIASSVWGVLWFFSVYSSPAKDKYITQAELAYIQEALGDKSEAKPVHPWKAIFSSQPVWAMVVAHFGHNWGYYTIVLYGVKYFKETEGLNIYLASLYASMGSFLLCFLVLIVSTMSDLIRSRQMLTTKQVRRIFTGTGFFLQAIFMFVAAFIHDKPVTFTAIIFGIGMGGISWAGFYANPLDIARPHAAVILGLSDMFATLPGIISPYVTASVIPADNPEPRSWEAVWIICAVFYTLAGIFFTSLSKADQQSWVYVPPTG